MFKHNDNLWTTKILNTKIIFFLNFSLTIEILWRNPTKETTIQINALTKESFWKIESKIDFRAKKMKTIHEKKNIKIWLKPIFQLTFSPVLALFVRSIDCVCDYLLLWFILLSFMKFIRTKEVKHKQMTEHRWKQRKKPEKWKQMNEKCQNVGDVVSLWNGLLCIFFGFFFRVCCCSLLLRYLLVFISFSIQFKVDFLSLSFFSLIIVKSIVLCASKCIIMKEIVMLYLRRNMHQHRVMRSETQTILWLLFF